MEGTAAGKWIKPAALALTVVASFSFTAVHAHVSDGPLETLTRARAKALKHYQDLVWRINLSLGAQLKFRVCSRVYDGLAPKDKAAIDAEASMGFEASAIPAAYFKPGSSGVSADELRGMRDPRVILIDAWDAMLVDEAAEYAARRNSAAEEPAPTGTTLNVLERASSEVGDTEIEPPKWMRGVGWDVAKKLMDLGLSADHLPILHSIAANFPLLAEVLSIAIDSAKESIELKVQELAPRLASEQLRDSSIPLAQRIRIAAAALEAPVPRPDPRRFAETERVMVERQRVVRDAATRFAADVDPILADEKGKVDALREGLREAEVQEPLGYLAHLGPREATRLEELYSYQKRLFFYERVIKDAMARGDGQADVWKKVLGSEYEDYRREAEAIHATGHFFFVDPIRPINVHLPGKDGEPEPAK